MNRQVPFLQPFKYLPLPGIPRRTTVAISVVMALLLLVNGAIAGDCETEFDQLIPTNRVLPSWKLGRAATDVLGGPHELFAYMTNYAALGSYNGAYHDGFYGSVSGAVAGYVAGFFPGLYHMVKRMSTGCLDMVTFWRPDVRPINRPTHALRGLGSETSDYFDKDPYWYIGPQR